MWRRTLILMKATAGLLWLSGCSGDPTTPAQQCLGDTVVEAGSVIEGMLEPGDFTDFEGDFVDSYVLQVPSLSTWRFTMRSTELDSVLWLYSAFTTLDADDNDGGGVNGLDAAIARVLPGGCYTIEATTEAVGAEGAYTLTVERF
ncbi:MAG: hypothetical protein WEG36_06055 [Gemmatimonadota bacterium]